MKNFKQFEFEKNRKGDCIKTNFLLFNMLLSYFILSVLFSPSVIAQIEQIEIPDSTFQYNNIEPLHDNAPDIATELPASMPQDNSVIPQLKPQHWANLKRKLFKEHGLGFGINYSGVYQNASESLTGNNTLAAGWLLLSLKWEAYQRNKDFQGSLVVTFDWRHTYNGGPNAATYIYDLGSLYGTDAAYFEWDPYFTNFFWEQWLKKDRFVFRIGQLTTYSVYTPFRFRDSRTQFSNSQFTAPAATIPQGPPGLGLNMKWWPIKDSEFYVVGTITDINAPFPGLGEYDWSGIFETGEFFSGLEFGYNWIRSERDFDHVHFDLFYATATSLKPFNSDKGWGFRASGLKQINKFVVYSNVGYNTSQGGGFGWTNSQWAFDLGTGYLDPFNIQGEILAAVTWAKPLDREFPDPVRRNISTDIVQGTFETNWSILLTPDLWVTPGYQLIWNPSFAPDTDHIHLPQIKFRLFL